MAEQPLVGQGLLIMENLRSQSDTLKLVGPPWEIDQTETETYIRNIYFTKCRNVRSICRAFCEINFKNVEAFSTIIQLPYSLLHRSFLVPYPG